VIRAKVTESGTPIRRRFPLRVARGHASWFNPRVAASFARRVRARLALGGLVTTLFIGACGPSRGTIGAVLARDSDGRLFVREVPSGLAAERAGIEPGDEILLIDGRDARALGPSGVHEVLSGNVGEPVKLTLVRRGEIVRVTLLRSEARRYPLAAETSAP
jgi:S1-C subfamily serine protease